jgi:pimeloyl-ACP methyl ester carboxylesterase
MLRCVLVADTDIDITDVAARDRADASRFAEPPDINQKARRYPGARRPDRSRWVDSSGLRIAVYEWGEPDAPVLLAAHGGFDFAGTYDVFAPMLADGGWRVVSWDARGHGDSERAVLYGWGADLRDAAAVLDSCGAARVAVLGHSKGGGVVLDLAHALPHRLTHLVNLDGLPSAQAWPDLPDHDRTRMLREQIEGWIAHRHRAARSERKPGTLSELAQRRRRMNPRLSVEWLEYLVAIGARQEADGSDTWRWKIDPLLRLGGFGPWRPEWSMERLPGVGCPFLGVLGLEPEEMGWGTRPENVRPNLPAGAEFHPLDGVGHFVHIEQPRLVADLVLDFLRRRAR